MNAVLACFCNVVNILKFLSVRLLILRIEGGDAMATINICRKIMSTFMVLLLIFPSMQPIALAATMDEDTQYLEAILGAKNASTLLGDSATGESARALADFLGQLEEFRSLFNGSRKATDKEIEGLREAFEKIAPHRENLKKVVNGLQDEYLDEELITKLEVSCAREDVNGTEVFKILLSGNASQKEVEDAALGVRSLSKECAAVVERAKEKLSIAEQAIQAEIAFSEREVALWEQQLATETDPAKKQELQNKIEREKAKIEQKKERRKEIQKKKASLDVLRLSLGIVAMLAAGVMTVVSGGTCSALCAKIFALGLANTATAIAEGQKETAEVVEIPGEPAKYEGLADPARKPAEGENLVFEIKYSELKILPTVEENGNFRIGVDAVGNLVLLQVAPPLKVVKIDLAIAKLTNLGNTNAQSLASAKWEKVERLEVEPTRVFLVINGIIDNVPARFGFSQEDVENTAFLVTTFEKK